MQRVLGAAMMSVFLLPGCNEDLELVAKEQVEEDCQVNAYGEGSCIFRNNSEYEIDKCVTVQLERVFGDGDCVDMECIDANLANIRLQLTGSQRLVSKPVCSGPLEPKGVVERTVMGFPKQPISICNPWPQSCNLFIEFVEVNQE
jgi:hypothetical protein